jgi:UDP-N-acetylmuramyl tripeptide synthase
LGAQPATVVANADDPLVVFAAGTAKDVTYVGVGLRWRQDAASCPNCGRPILRDELDWWCTCGLRRPPAYELEGDDLVLGRQRVTLHPGVPGHHNVANAALALVAATKLGVPLDVAAGSLGTVKSVVGRYETITVGSNRARLLLAKNPAGWGELLAMIEQDERPLVLGINARIADGRDPSWLWDVEFEMLHGRRVIAAGERAADLAVRLRYADVDCEMWDGSMLGALERFEESDVDVVANYTAFAELVRAVGTTS